MISKIEIVNQVKDNIASDMLQVVWQQLFKQDYTECLAQMANDPFWHDGKMYRISRSADIGTGNDCIYLWGVKCVTTEGMWEICFKTTTCHRKDFGGHDAYVDDFEILDTYNHEYDDLLKGFIEFVTFILSTRHSGGAPLEIPEAQETENVTD